MRNSFRLSRITLPVCQISFIFKQPFVIQSSISTGMEELVDHFLVVVMNVIALMDSMEIIARIRKMV